MFLLASHPLADGRTANSPLIANYCARRERGTGRPVWFMRQAGRSLPEYHRVRRGTSMLQACLIPELAAEITCQPVRRYGVDAGIFYSDIMIPVRLAGLGVDIVPGIGPVLDQPIRCTADLQRLQPLTADMLAPITQAVALCTAELGATPLIGFAGAPFTVASYLVEGKPSKTHEVTREFMRCQPEVWNALLRWAADISAEFLLAQIFAGASAVQIFDSWAGRLSVAEYRKFAAPYTRLLVDKISGIRAGEGADSVPIVHFAAEAAQLLDDIASLDSDSETAGASSRLVLGLSSDCDIAQVAAAYPNRVLQGNLDPRLLEAPWPDLSQRVHQILDSTSEVGGHVFNLGHGVPKNTDPAVLARIVELVHSWEN